AFGLKKPSGFGRLATSSRLRAADPASRKPAFRPTRGSFAAAAFGAVAFDAVAPAAGAGRSCARPSSVARAHAAHALSGATRLIDGAPPGPPARVLCAIKSRRRRVGVIASNVICEPRSWKSSTRLARIDAPQHVSTRHNTPRRGSMRLNDAFTRI